MNEAPITTAEYAYTILLRPEPEGGFTVTCPSLPGLVTYGATREEARAMAADAIEGYLKCLREDGEPIPESDWSSEETQLEEVRVKLPLA